MFNRLFVYHALWAVFVINTSLVLLFATGFSWLSWTLLPLVLLGVYDRYQTKHAVLRNYPVIGHFRYLIEAIRPELRQYIVESDSEKLPYSREQRSIVYQRAKGEPEAKSFGTKVQMDNPSHKWLIHSMAPTTLPDQDFYVTVGEGSPDVKKPHKMSLLNISAMSFGSLSANAIRALNKGAAKGGFTQDTGEGSVSPYHLEHNGDLIWELGSGYFGCRDEKGQFSPNKFATVAAMDQVKMIEIKLSQGAKPGHGGVLPASKITLEIAQTRGIDMDKDCVSPASHSAFNSPLTLMTFIQQLRKLSGGKPVGIKLCVGQPWEWFGICKAMLATGIHPDFIVVDGSEGGTGAAPMEFADHVGMPLQDGLQLVHNTLVGIGLRDKIRIGASGKIITAFDIMYTLALGADWINSARGFLFSLGCIQALSCSSGQCPTGIATQDPERQKALVVEDKAERVYRFHHNTLHAVKELTQATGLRAPQDIRPDHVMLRQDAHTVCSLADVIKSNVVTPNSLANLEDGLHQTSRYPEVYRRWWESADINSFGIK